LRNVPERHRSLRAVFQNSWQRLSGSEQTVLSKLSVFRGGFGRNAAEAVAGASLRLLSGLVDKSLLRVNREGRYELHELLRQFAAEKLGQTPGDHEQSRDLHCRFYLDFLSGQDRHLKGAGHKEALTAISSDIDNVRAAWRWAVKQNHRTLIGPALEPLCLFYEVPGWFLEGEDAMGRAVAMLKRQGATEQALGEDASAPEFFILLGRALTYLGWFQIRLGRLGQAEDTFQDSLALLRPPGGAAQRDTAFCLFLFGFCRTGQGMPSQASILFQESVELFEASGDLWGQGTTLNTFAQLFHNLGQYDEAERMARESIARLNQIGERRMVLYNLSNLGRIAQARGNYGEAEAFHQECLARRSELGDRPGLAYTQKDLGEVTRQQGRLIQAEQHYRQSLAIAEEIGLRQATAQALWGLGNLAEGVGDYAAARYYYEQSQATQKSNPTSAGPGWVSLGLDELSGAKRYFQELLRTTIATQQMPLALDALAGLIHLQARAEQRKQALELSALVLHHPASAQETKDRVARLQTELAAVLPPAVVKTAQTRGKSLDLGETAAALLEELAAPGEEVQEEKRAHNLPVQATPFIGREEELSALAELLANPDLRLVTIVGPGGIGKTRLSLAVAEQFVGAVREPPLQGQSPQSGGTLTHPDQFPDGAFFIPLAPLESAEHIVSATAEAIGYRFHGDREPRQQLLDYLRRKQMLLVMDNFEQLLGGTHPHDGAELVSELVGHAPEVEILVTSRERLHLTGEAVFRIAGLAYPDGSESDEKGTGKDIIDYGAVKLLLHHARLMRPGLEPGEQELVMMARICRLVQGMPLALVLAASWLELLSFKEIADEIGRNLDILESESRDLPARQRSMRAAFATSWGRLAAGERDVFMKLSVFRGGFTRRASQTVAGASLPVLRALAEKSLIAATRPERYEIHELLRQFAEEKLFESRDEDETRGAHSAYYLRAMSDREADLKGRRQLQALEEIESDLENVRAAWNWALRRQEERDVDDALESLGLFFYSRGRFQDGDAWFRMTREKLVAVSRGQLWGRLLARHVWMRSEFAPGEQEVAEDLDNSRELAFRHEDQAEIAFTTMLQGYLLARLDQTDRRPLEHLKRSLELYEDLGDRFFMGLVLNRIGYSSGSIDDYMVYTRQSLEIAREAGIMVHIAHALTNLASGALCLGDYAVADTYLREAIDTASELQLHKERGHSSAQTGLLSFLVGDMERAQQMAETGADIARDINFPITLAYALSILGLHAAVVGDYEFSRQHGLESIAIRSNVLGVMLGDWALSVAYIGLAQGDLAKRHLVKALDMSVERSWPATITWLLPAAVIIEARGSRNARAVQLLSLAMNHPLSAIGWIEQWALLAETHGALERKLGAEAYQDAWERGKGLELEKVAAELLAAYGE
jgi:predicted ATPase